MLLNSGFDGDVFTWQQCGLLNPAAMELSEDHTFPSSFDPSAVLSGAGALTDSCSDTLLVRLCLNSTNQNHMRNTSLTVKGHNDSVVLYLFPFLSTYFFGERRVMMWQNKRFSFSKPIDTSSLTLTCITTPVPLFKLRWSCFLNCLFSLWLIFPLQIIGLSQLTVALWYCVAWPAVTHGFIIKPLVEHKNIRIVNTGL